MAPPLAALGDLKAWLQIADGGIAVVEAEQAEIAQAPAHQNALLFVALELTLRHVQTELKGPGDAHRVAFSVPRFQERCHPCDQYTRGLEDMTNASLQRGRQS